MRQWVDTQIDRLGGLLLPPRCVLCGARGQPPCLDLCAACERDLPRNPSALIVGPTPLGWQLAPFEYGHPVDHLVHALKYRGQLAVARVLGSLLGQRVRAAALDQGIDVVVPVPLHPFRHAERTFNQSAEIARWAARHLCRRFDASLVMRCRQTPPQVGLSGPQRRANLAGAFAAAAGVRGLRIALVDDVTTTGTTVCELAEALQAAGARSVDAWCLCRASPLEQVDLAQSSEGRQA